MGSPFKVNWDDFTGGYYVGESDSKQPRNTWTGTNVNVTTHDGSLAATNSIRQIAVSGSIADATVSSDSIWFDAGSGSNNYILDVIATGSGFVVLQYQVVTGSPLTYRFRLIGVNASDAPERSLAPAGSPGQSIWGLSASSWVSVTGSARQPSNLVFDGTYVYVTWYDTLYRYQQSTWTSTTATIPGSVGYTKIGIYKDRMFAVAAYTESKFYFSDALDFMTWPTLNFIGVGAPQSVITTIVPRYDDLLVTKTDGIYSIIGTLSINAALRQVYDGIYFQNRALGAPKTLYSKNNRLFYVDQNTAPYQANVKYLYGQQDGVAAYYNFGRRLPANGVDLAGSFNDQLMATFPQDSYGQQGFFSLVRFANGRWMRMAASKFTFYDPTPANKSEYFFRYMAINDQIRPFTVSGQDWAQPILYAQVATRRIGTSPASQRYEAISFGFVYPEQTGSGTSDYSGWVQNTSTANFDNFSEPSSGTVILSPIETEQLSKITAVYVETTLDLDYDKWGDLAGTASMQVTSINQAVDDIAFNSTTYTAVSGTTTTNMSSFGSPYKYPGIYQFPIETGSGAFIPEPTVRLNANRILRFRPDDAGYGYKHNVSITFSGYRIKRVWVEGETR